MTSNRDLAEQNDQPGCEPPPDCSSFSIKHDANSREARQGSDPVAKSRASLARIIENRVIPKLLLAHRENAFRAPLVVSPARANMSERVGEFADLIIAHDGRRATTYFKDMIDGGTSVETLFQDLVGPTARRLGELWDEDINSIMDVTQGMGHLQQIVRTFAPDFRADPSKLPTSRRALLMAMPGEKHTLGISLIEEYFRREGWAVWGGPVQTLDEVVALVGTMWFDVIGLSASRVADPEKFSLDIRIIREAARNRNLAILIGGLPFLQDPGLAAIVGADVTAADGSSALHQVSRMITVPQRQI